MIFCLRNRWSDMQEKLRWKRGGGVRGEKRGKSHSGSRSCDWVVTTHSQTVMRTHSAALPENGFRIWLRACVCVCMCVFSVKRSRERQGLTLNPGYHSFWAWHISSVFYQVRHSGIKLCHHTKNRWGGSHLKPDCFGLVKHLLGFGPTYLLVNQSPNSKSINRSI